MASGADRRRLQLFTTLGTLLERIPIDLAVALAEIGGAVASANDSPKRRAVETNLRRIVELDADEPVDPQVLKRLVRRSFSSYGRYWAEGAVLPGMDRDEIRKRITIVEGVEYLHEAMAEGNGCIVALPHIGSWEWGGALVGLLGYPMTAVAERLEPPELFEWFVTKREQMGLLVEGLDEQAGRKLLSVLKQGEVPTSFRCTPDPCVTETLKVTGSKLISWVDEPRCPPGLRPWPCARGRPFLRGPRIRVPVLTIAS